MAKLFGWLGKNGLTLSVFVLLFFIPLYPKFPLLDIQHTWVYIRLEDILLALIAGFWILQLFRKKVTLKTPLTIFILFYWLIGFASSLFALLVLRKILPNILPQLVVLHYLRRIEYIFVFFVAFSTIKGLKQVKNYLLFFGLVVALVCFYGFGQKFLGFPAFLTMNEEFAKGAPLYLGPQSRLTSTFAGHYDLAAFLVFVIAIFGSLIFGVKKNLVKFGLFLLVLTSFLLLLFTSSRISFGAYLVGVVFMLFLQRKKWLIIPVVVGSLVALSFVSGAIGRFGKTLRVENVVYDATTGQAIGALDEGGETEIEELPLGSGYLASPIIQTRTPQTAQVVKIKRARIYELKTASESSQIATISGEFLIKKAIVYDISLTTRLQGTWKRAFDAFSKSPLLGTGYSTIGLGSDSSFIRSLGEIGLIGFLSFLSILIAFGLLLKQALVKIKDKFAFSFLSGVAGGTLGLSFNALLIDVFEASKMAYIFWLVLGISVGLIGCYFKPKNLFKEAWQVALRPVSQIIILLILGLIVFGPSVNNYFVADDFTWLKWAGGANLERVVNNFYFSDGFFYRPLAKAYFFLIYSFFGLHPNLYHLGSLAFHLGTTATLFITALLLSKKKAVAFLVGLLFLLFPLNAENIYWISSTSAMIAAFFLSLSFLSYFLFRSLKSQWGRFFYPFSLIFFILGLISHESAIVLPGLIVALEVFILSKGKIAKRFILIIPFVILIANYLHLRTGSQAHGLSGDYNYNLVKLPFNVAGNLLGYLGLVFFGERFLPLYQHLRDGLRNNSLWTGVIIVPVAVTLIFFIKRLWREKIFLFGLSWFVINLLPYLGLGNIAERYLYPAHFGLFLSASVLLVYFLEKIRINSRKLSIFILAFILVFSTIFLSVRSRQHGQRWQEAGEKSREILLAFGTNFETFAPETTLYFVDLPIRHERAWVFPVGLTDGLWLLYHNELNIQNLETLNKAKEFKKLNPTAQVFIYEDDVLKKMVLEEE